MRIQKLILTLILSVVLFSCGSNDEPGSAINIYHINIVGNWQFSGSTTNGIPDEFDADCDERVQLSFLASGEMSRTIFDDNCDPVFTFNMNYTIVDETFTITFNGESKSSTIRTLNETTFTYAYNQDADILTESFTKL
ncbi:lipocalin-like domain-containing protein [Ulvibacter antarcticus]|uniref:Lipocalin-like protein n=1 Tax=Ulvibacter antarcticus TaxID=442714 RepID=A0A3L9Y975_9FLAO|nr:lipocalin family protein [Ulvibacter antarcticus]RMA57251.1 lipocalin-like protein [Ulvibacter antarcticus]